MTLSDQQCKQQADSDPLARELDSQWAELRAKLKCNRKMRHTRWKTVFHRLRYKFLPSYRDKHKKASLISWREKHQKQIDDFRY